MQFIKSKIKEGSMKYLGMVFVLALGVSCKNSSDLTSPSYISVPAGFAVLPSQTADPDSVFYATSYSIAFYSILTSTSVNDTFKANLSDVVSWNVDLLGLSSGATKRISGTSNVVNAVWNGGNDGLYFFKKGEDVEATLSFYGTELQLKDTVTISGTRLFTDINAPNGYTITNMENPVGSYPSSPSAWFNFHDPSGSAGVPGPAEEQIYNAIGTGLKSVEGDGYYLFEGVDRPALNSSYSTYFILGAGFQQNVPLLAGLTNPNPDPDSLYFNVYVYGFGLGNTKFQVGFDEDDNSNGAWLNANEDELVYVTRVDWTGWKLISFRYSDTKFSNVDPNGGAHGNHVREPGKIIKMGFVMNSDPPLYHSKVAFDFPCFTYGHSFNPNN
jgi:hypothetical protein